MLYASKISAQFFLKLIKKYLAVIVLITVLAGGLSVYANLTLNGNLYVSKGELVQSDNNYNLLSSYKEFANSNRFKSLVDSQLVGSKWHKTFPKDNYTVTIQTASDSSSPFFEVEVSSSNKYYSEYVANVAMKVFITNIGKYLSGTNVSTVSEATKGAVSISKTSVIKSAWHGAVLGLIISSLFLIIKEIVIGKVRDFNYIANIYSIAYLGTMDISDKAKK